MSSRYARDGNDKGNSTSKSSVSTPRTPRTEGEILQSSNLKNFSYNELKAATRNFRPDSVLGEGGFGSVFKGWIDEQSFAVTKPGTGLVIAVKRLNQEGFQGHREWLVSITLSTIAHGLYFEVFCWHDKQIVALSLYLNLYIVLFLEWYMIFCISSPTMKK